MVNGGFPYKYLFISQHPDIEKVFTAFLNDVRPARILEIGTLHGGLTLMIKDILISLGLESTSVRTYDIEDQEFLKPIAKELNIEVFTQNIFNASYRSLKDAETEQMLIEYIQQDGQTIILCDGGCKPCEYNILAPLLKNGDIIMAHDYSPNKQFFQETMFNKIWDWMEIQDLDIERVSKEYNLVPYKQEDMLSVAWNCRKKTCF